MYAMFQDLRVAGRSLRRAPGFAASTIAALAIGIAGSTLVFSVAYTLLFHSLPYAQAERLVVVDPNPARWQIFEQLRDAGTVFEEIGAYTDKAANLTGPEGPERILVAHATGSFLRTPSRGGCVKSGSGSRSVRHGGTCSRSLSAGA